jgi:hypothetical protein
MERTGWWFNFNKSFDLEQHPVSGRKVANASFPQCQRHPSWPGLLLNGNLLAHFQRAFVQRVAVTPGIASLNPGLLSLQPFRAAGLHAGGVKEISPR